MNYGNVHTVQFLTSSRDCCNLSSSFATRARARARERVYVKETPLLVVSSYFGAQVLGLLAVEQENFALKASAPSNIEVVVADAGNIHLLKS